MLLPQAVPVVRAERGAGDGLQREHARQHGGTVIPDSISALILRALQTVDLLVGFALLFVAILPEVCP